MGGSFENSRTSDGESDAEPNPSNPFGSLLDVAQGTKLADANLAAGAPMGPAGCNPFELNGKEGCVTSKGMFYDQSTMRAIDYLNAGIHHTVSLSADGLAAVTALSQKDKAWQAGAAVLRSLPRGETSWAHPSVQSVYGGPERVWKQAIPSLAGAEVAKFAVDRMLFPNSRSGNLTLTADLLSPAVVLTRLPLVAKVGVMLGAHIAGKYGDSK